MQQVVLFQVCFAGVIALFQLIQIYPAQQEASILKENAEVVVKIVAHLI
jgi:hypothetical protein